MKCFPLTKQKHQSIVSNLLLTQTLVTHIIEAEIVETTLLVGVIHVIASTIVILSS